MNVYRVRADVAYGVALLAGGKAEREAWNQAVGKTSAALWQAPTLELEPDDEFVPVDCASSATTGGRGLLLNQRARDALAPLLLPCGEFLPVSFGKFDYRWFNCTTMIDAADQERIEGTHDESPHVPPELWVHITRWAFRPERLVDAPAIFSVPQESVTHLICTDMLKQAVEAHDLLGFEFEHLWSSETGGVQIDPGPGKLFGAAGRALQEANRRKREAALARLSTL